MRIVKQGVVSALIFSFSFQACYSYSSISKEQILPDHHLISKDIKIRLRNGQTINSGSYQHIYISEPSDFYFGLPLESEGIYKRGNMIIYKSDVISDSTYSNDNGTFIKLNLSDSTSYIFDADKLLDIKPAYGTGLMCRGIITKTKEKFYGIINEYEITGIETKKLSILQTVVLPSVILFLVLLNALQFISFKT